MARAEELALKGRLRAEPNPIVGCVIVKGNRVIAEGHHARFGGQHAEVSALRKARGNARNATVYVTLEPCGHTGKTPPCATALIRAGVTEVVYAIADPNPLTAGRGPAMLRDAGIKVTRVSPTKSLRAMMEPYLGRVNRKRPWVIAKWGMSLDGK
ncbi:MAG: bifunctional diaminohydroxyphosphoribosylaminopyrimidine deaminase/5-amino-6-(5-phosphoribosylamino)uracil reductase RibD, partial [Planctomycetota bacterium]